MQLTIVLNSTIGDLPASFAVTVEHVDGTRVEVTQGSSAGVFQAELRAGEYRISAEADGLVAPTQNVHVGSSDITVTVFLGEEGWPYYRLGRSLVPYPPRDDVMAVALREPEPADDDDAARPVGSLDGLAASLGLVGYRPTSSDDATTSAETVYGEGTIRLYTPEDRGAASRDAMSTLFDRMQNALGDSGRVGMPVNLRPGRAAIIDRYFAVRFESTIDPDQAAAIIDRSGADVIRPLAQSPNGYLIRFRSGHPRDHLGRIEAMHREGLVIYGEPDLIVELVDDSFPYSDPNDPTFASQVNLTLQRFPEAWTDLADIDPKMATGGPRVTVASIDRGIDTDHPDLGGKLTDGTDQMSRCFDFSGMRECTVAGYAPDTSHGMGVYGIIGAAANNNEDIAGITPNAHHIGLERPTLTSVNYSDVLLWAAGFNTGNTSTGWPAEPLRAGADIISCSHGSDGLALSGVMDDTFKTLASQGRGGLGTIVVYSAGNSNRLITGFRTWAAHSNTIAVANSTQPNAAGVETKDATSNFGPEIDVCAQGTSAPSLNHTGGEQTFGGTSAAAPTVASLCALILAVDPMLTWRQVRDILRQTAVRIDPDNTDPAGQWNGHFSQWYGYGRIDAANAVRLARPHRGRVDTDHDSDGTAEIPITSPWGIGTLDFTSGSMTALAMAANGSRFNGWLLNTRDNRFDVIGDLDGDGAAELLVTSPWGIGVLNVASGTYTATMLRRNGTRFDGWLLNTRDNRVGPVGDFNGDGRAEFLVTSPWGVGVFRLSGTTFDVPLIRPNGTRFDGWLLNTADNRFGPVGDFDGDGIDELVVTSPWGIGLLKLDGSTFRAVVIKPNGTRFGGWLLNTRDNWFGPVGDFDGDGADEIVISSPWGIGLLKLNGSTLDAKVIKKNGTRFGGWLLNTHDNYFRGTGRFTGGNAQLFVTSPWGIGILGQAGNTFNSVEMAPNGSRFDGWLLNTDDNHFKRFADLTGDGRTNVLLTSPWGIGILGVANSGGFSVPFMAPNGTRFGGWLLNTADNML